MGFGTKGQEEKAVAFLSALDEEDTIVVSSNKGLGFRCSMGLLFGLGRRFVVPFFYTVCTQVHFADLNMICITYQKKKKKKKIIQ